MGKVSVFSDDVEEIAHEVKQFFDEDLVLNDELVELISNSYQHEINSPHLKMLQFQNVSFVSEQLTVYLD